MEKTNLPAPKIEFSLGFFARLIWADTSMLHFAVLIRHFNEDGIDGKVQHPAISITGLDKYAFDLVEARFVRLAPDVELVPAQADVQKNGLTSITHSLPCLWNTKWLISCALTNAGFSIRNCSEKSSPAAVRRQRLQHLPLAAFGRTGLFYCLTQPAPPHFRSGFIHIAREFHPHRPGVSFTSPGDFIYAAPLRIFLSAHPIPHIAAASFTPSAAALVIPPAYPAPSPAGYTPWMLLI